MERYKEFEDEVRALDKGYDEWQHLLAAVPQQYRVRYTDSLKAGWDMPAAFDIVMTSTHMEDAAFTAMLAEKNPGKD
ncbi:MAG: hypothetical protein EOP51_05270 [Sphingobacteriales bacterium]|nr:MAG: hypothetical protein EOP51_05270 [Sphingobacteriales bacterium]